MSQVCKHSGRCRPIVIEIVTERVFFVMFAVATAFVRVDCRPGSIRKTSTGRKCTFCVLLAVTVALEGRLSFRKHPQVIVSYANIILRMSLSMSSVIPSAKTNILLVLKALSRACGSVVYVESEQFS